VFSVAAPYGRPLRSSTDVSLAKACSRQHESYWTRARSVAPSAQKSRGVMRPRCLIPGKKRMRRV
jgi:hypothetical protein